MNVISQKSLKSFYDRHSPARAPMIAWYKEVSWARWQSLHELKGQFPSADYIGDDRVVFDIGGNRYRIVARVAYAPWYRVMIKFVGSHADYDRIDARTI